MYIPNPSALLARERRLAVPTLCWGTGQSPRPLGGDRHSQMARVRLHLVRTVMDREGREAREVGRAFLVGVTA